VITLPTRASIIIVNWNGKHLLKQCLSSVFAQSMIESPSGDSSRAKRSKDFEVILVDNASADGSADFVKKAYPKVKIIQNRSNRGFAEGNNIGIRAASKGSKYIALLNTDARPSKNWLKELIAAAESHPESGSFTPKVVFPDGRINSAGHAIFRTGEVRNIGVFQEDKGQFDREAKVFGVAATASLYRRRMLEDTKMGGNYFDPLYFAYYEDSDLDFRAAALGWESLCVPSTKVIHILGASSPDSIYFVERNRMWFFLKNFPTTELLVSLPFFLAYSAVRLIYVAFFKLQPMAALRALIDGAAGIPKVLRKRAETQAVLKRRAAKPIRFEGTGLGALLGKMR